MIDYNYSYNLRLRFVNPKQTDSFENHKIFFENCVDKYNADVKSARNPKKIEIKNINSNYIDICLYSNADLTKAPGKALMHLSTLLLNKGNANFDNYFANHLYYNKLFYTEQISAIKKHENLSDAEFVKGLIDYITKPKTEISEKEKSAMNRIKLIALENGLI